MSVREAFLPGPLSNITFPETPSLIPSPAPNLKNANPLPGFISSPEVTYLHLVK